MKWYQSLLWTMAFVALCIGIASLFNYFPLVMIPLAGFCCVWLIVHSTANDNGPDYL